MIDYYISYILKLIKDSKISFIKSIGDQHLLVNAIFASAKTFKIPRKKVGKFIINRIDEGKNLTNQINNDSAIDKLTVALLALAKNQQQIAPATTTNETQSFKIATSPQIKRKASSSIENNYITLDDESENDNSNIFCQ